MSAIVLSESPPAPPKVARAAALPGSRSPVQALVLARAMLALTLGFCVGVGLVAAAGAAASPASRTLIDWPALGVLALALVASALVLQRTSARRANAVRLQPSTVSAVPSGADGLDVLTAAVGARPLGKTDAGRARREQAVQAWLVLAAVAAVAAQVGVWRMQAVQAGEAQAVAEVQRFSGPRQVRGLVADDPAPRGRTTSLTLSEVLVSTPDGWVPLQARLLVSVPHWPEHEYGEYLQLRGKLQPLAGGSGSVEALQRQGVLASMSYPRVSYLANPQANPALQAIFALRHHMGGAISAIVPDPAASTLQATVLGLRSGLPKDEQQALVDTGTVHLVAISGFKLTLVAAGFELLGLWLLRRISGRQGARAAVILGVLAAIGAYTLLTGATPSAVRAAIMASAVALARLAGRSRDQVSALALAVLGILAFKPVDLQDGGFQLSCLSVLGIALLAEPLAARIQRGLRRLPGALAGGIAEAIATSAAATAFILPVLAGSFHVVSLVSPAANLVGMPLLGPVMLFGGLGALLGAIALPLGAIFLWPAWAFTTLLEALVHASASVPYASLPIDGMPAPAVVAYYALLLLAVVWLKGRRIEWQRRPAKRKLTWSAAAAGALLATASTAYAARPPTTLRATFLPVPGQATLIQTPSGRKVLVDGGQSGPELLRQLGQLLAPWDRTIDLLVVTSSRTDHIGALSDVLARYQVRALAAPDVRQPSATFRRLLDAAPRTEASEVDLGGGATLTRVADDLGTSTGPTGRAIDAALGSASQGFTPVAPGSTGPTGRATNAAPGSASQGFAPASAPGRATSTSATQGSNAWRLDDGQTTIELRADGATVQPSGQRIVPMLASKTPAPQDDDALQLADTGPITVSFGQTAP